MADEEDKVSGSVPGPFYVDSQCIDCDACRTEAPDNFTRNDDDGFSYVYKQPKDDKEKEECDAAMDACPVEAIGIEGQGDS